MLDDEEKPARPFVKWAGGKTSLLPELLKRVPRKFGMYHEPFVGGGALFFALRAVAEETMRHRHPAIIGDANDRLMTTYKAIRDDVAEVIRLLLKLKNDKKTFLRVRGWDVDTLGPAMVAAWFIYLNKTCFNGLYRVNRSDQFNVPFAGYKNPTICDLDNMRAVAEALSTKTTIQVAPFERVLSQAEKGDFVYFDPPYMPLSQTSNFTNYSSAGFGRLAHQHLRDLARELKSRGVRVLVSNNGHPEIRKLYAKGFKVEEVHAARNINSKGDGRGKLVDLLIS